MKFYNISTILKAMAAKPLDTQSTTFNLDLPIIRFIDYLSAGIDEVFSHTYTQSGGKEAYSKHKDYILSCVNSILTEFGDRALKGISNSEVLVPRIPREFMGNVDSEWDFIESCDHVRGAFSGYSVVSINTDEVSASSIFGLEEVKKINSSVNGKAVFFKSSLLYGYISNAQEMAYAMIKAPTKNKIGEEPSSTDAKAKPSIVSQGVVKIQNSKVLNLDPNMKYIDEAIEKNRPRALEFLKKVLEFDPSTITVTNDNSGEAKNDIKNLQEAKDKKSNSNNAIVELLNNFKKIVPEDGNVFLSPNQIERLIPLLEYIRVGGQQYDDFFSILTNGMDQLEKSGVNFGEHLKVAGNVQNILMQGNYDLVVGYKQEGDTTHTKQFRNKGEMIFVGYITNYPNQVGDSVIPVYFTTKDPNVISDFSGKIGEPLHVKSLKTKGVEIPFKNLNTQGTAKRTGGNETIFQLPYEIFSVAGQPETQEAQPISKPAAKEEKASMTNVTPKSNVAKKNEAKPAEAKPEKQPTLEPVAVKKPTGETQPQILTRIGNEYATGKLTREKAILKIQKEMKEKLNTMASATKVGALLDKKFSPSAENPSKERSKAEIDREHEYDNLFGPEFRNTKLAPSAIPRLTSLAKLGHDFTSEEIDNLVSRGLPRDKVEKAVMVPSSVVEVRNPSGSFNLKALMENLNSKRLK